MEIFFIILFVVVANSIYHNWQEIRRVLLRWKSRRKIKATGELFDRYFIEAKSFYLQRFNRYPSIAYIGNLDVSKAIDPLNKGRLGKILDVYKRSYFNWQDENIQYSRQLVELEGEILVEIDDDSFEIFFPEKKRELVEQFTKQLAGMKAPEKEKEYEMNIISVNNNQLELKTINIKPTPLDIGMYYNDDFIKVDTIIKERLAKKEDKGIVLMHGLPGTGKTTYLRHLIGTLEKKVMFVSPRVAENLVNPEFMDLLIDNPNSVLVIEDAENIILDRKYNSNSSVSNLLNISDGLLSDCLNVQIICTFNSDIAMVDNALMRKGRLIAKYEFGKLAVDKAQALSDHLGFDSIINKPMTLAEISNQHEMIFETKRVEVLGFRREAVLEN